MLATAGPVPTSAGWAFEIKFDGVRAVAYARDGGLRLFSRNDRDVSSSYPEIGAIGLDEGVVVDGELVALDARGRPDFGRLQHRMHVAAPTVALIAEIPVQYVVFDLLRRGGRSTLGLSYLERRALLDELGLDGAGVVRVPPNFTDIAGSVVQAAAEQQGLEGVVAKRVDSTYQPGRRSRSWIKTAIRHTHEVLVAGWSAGSGNRHNSIGALLLAAHDDSGRLVYVGDVGTGFTDAARGRLLQQLRAMERAASPFDGEFARARGWSGRAPGRGEVRWVDPVLVGEIEYRSFTPEGAFRHPSWRGLRPDRDPGEVRLPAPD
ncbi:non-homologous end-joining DNA ligase [Pseudonocardia saturnea]